MTLVAALSRAARYGEYFETQLDSAPPPFDLGAALEARATRLGTTEARVAASALQYEFAERLWAVSLGAWAFGRVVPDLTALKYGCADDSTLILGFTAPVGTRADTPGEVAGLLYRNVVDVQLAPFHQLLRATVKMADGLLWGNAATALVLAARSASRARSCYAATALLLEQPPLAGRLTGPVATPKRRSCCLYYRTAAGRTCSDCPLPKVPA
ncbi:hypothetical protein BVC93_12300 [Mycobacterium sp. MS1601]|uniref:(2Fe-2S)-binding protein n=1 Tax=Mycobacterium sp. MS1601 TaxID=1936029 RepID=UPI00097973C1|nr:(2Fe-2S)-binding protein [Mycobacterium sp. MS1601]AQA03082.1 hypothetical protein BVC93_12300 [Mycobacterium sp. MS1601]